MVSQEQRPASIFDINLREVLALMIVVTIMTIAVPAAQAQTLTVLYNFGNGGVGSEPLSGLIMDQAGRLYGTAYDGGRQGYGTVYRASRAGSRWTVTPLYSFQGGTDGSPGPWYSLAMDQAGNLYGTTQLGGANEAGTIFKLAPSGGGWTYTDLYDFTGVSGGNEPGSNVVFDSQGNLYGTAQFGGTGCFLCGVVWEITP